MEQFERDGVQPVVDDDYLAGRIGEETLKSKGRAWENYAGGLSPAGRRYAKAHAMPVIAANAPASLVRCVGRQGLSYLSTLPASKRGWALPPRFTPRTVLTKRNSWNSWAAMRRMAERARRKTVLRPRQRA